MENVLLGGQWVAWALPGADVIRHEQNHLVAVPLGRDVFQPTIGAKPDSVELRLYCDLRLVPDAVPVSDVAALLSIGLCAIGWPNNRGGAADLAELLETDAREIVVFGERDGRPDGTWPGDPVPFARELGQLLGRPVRAQLPPPPCKDVREFIGSRLQSHRREG